MLDESEENTRTKEHQTTNRLPLEKNMSMSMSCQLAPDQEIAGEASERKFKFDS